METIQFTYGNFRYLTFELDGQYYLLDRSPQHCIGYLYPPLNWFFHQKVYLITQEEFFKLRQKNLRAANISIPASFSAGLGVLIYNWFRLKNIDISIYFNTKFSFGINLLFLLVSVILAYILANLFYFYRKKHMISILGSELYQPVNMRVKPQKLNFKQLIGYLVIVGGLTSFMAGYYLYSGNLLYCFITMTITFLHFIGANGAFGTEANQFYKIVDIKEEH